MTATAPPAQVRAYGWELHQEDGSSDKFYRIIVFLGPEPGVVVLYGKRSSDGQHNVKPFPSALDAIRFAKTQTQDKERKGYELSRDYTRFWVPAEMAGTLGRTGHRFNISRLFGAAAREQNTALPNASVIR